MEELSPYKELFTTVVPEQDLVAAATSCFLQLPILLSNNFKFNCQSGEFNCQSGEFNSQSDEFICQQYKFNCKSDEFNCQNLYVSSTRGYGVVLFYSP